MADSLNGTRVVAPGTLEWAVGYGAPRVHAELARRGRRHDIQKAAKSTAAKQKTYEGFTDEERAAMKEHAQELKSAGRSGALAA